MEIIKSSFLNPKKCEYGNFELVPEKGWKISDTFIDFESKLLIVSTSILDKNKWIDNKYNYTIPTKEFKIDLSTLKILDFEGWKKFFNYEKQEILSYDGKLKLIYQRNYEEDHDSDGIKEELYEIEANKLIASSDSIAFCERKRENLLENHYNRLKEYEEYKKKLENKLTLNQFYEKYLQKLEKGKTILSYYNFHKTFKLEFENNQFLLYKSNQFQFFNLKKSKYTLTSVFSTLNDFWNFFTSNNDWYKEFSINKELTEQPLVLSKFIFNSFHYQPTNLKIRQ